MSSAPLIARDHLQPAIRLLRRMAGHWGVGVLAFAVGLAGTAAVSSLRPRQYRSEAVVHYREGMQWTTNEGQGVRRIGQRLKDTLLARSQLAKVIEDLGLYPDLVKNGRIGDAVEEMLAVTGFRISEGDIFVVSFTGDSPQEAQRVTAKLTDVLIAENTRLRSAQAEVAQAFLDTEKRRNETELAAREAELLRFLARHPEFAQEQQGAAGLSLRARPRVDLESDGSLAALRREELRLRSQIATTGQAPRAPRDPQVLIAARNEAETRLRTAQREQAEQAARFTEQHPDVRSAAGRVKEAEEAYQRAVADVQAADRAVTPAAREALEAQLVQVQQDIATFTRPDPRVRAVGSANRNGTAQRVVALESEWTRLNRDVAEARERFQQLDSRQFLASMTLSTLTSGQAAQIVVVDPAYLPAKPTGMRAQRFYIMGFGVALLLGIGMTVLVTLLDDRIRDRQDAEQLEIAPVLAEVAQTPTAVGPRAKADERPAEVKPAPGVTPPTRALLQRAAPSAMVARVEEPEGVLALGGVGNPGGSRSLEGRVNVHRHPQALQADPRLFLLAAPDSPAAASFRVLRHRLREQKAGKVILVTSPGAGDGKTLCALNLALALGEGGQAKVLLLEANFRAPSLARLLGFQPPVCFQKQLEYYRALNVHSWDVAETASPWLHTAAVAPDRTALPTLDGAALAACIEDMRTSGYDHIIIDGPPVLGSADANLLEESADGVLMVLRAGSSRAAQFRRAVDQIGESRLLGLLLLGT